MNKREQKAMLIWFFLTIVIFILLIVTIIFYIYPNLLNIEEKKEVLNWSKNNSISLINKYDTLVQKGLSYNEFGSWIIEYKNDKEIEKLLLDPSFTKAVKEIDQNFYNEVLSFSWTSKWNFLTFIKKKNQDLIKILQTDEFKKQVWEINSILPLYSLYVDLEKENSLSDLKFINYINSLFNKYDFILKSDIWIKDIVPIEGTDIYYIPLEVDVRAMKGKLLQFIDYISKTWIITYDDLWQIKIKKNLYSINKNKIDQLSELYSIELDEYINDTWKAEKIRRINESLDEFLKNTRQDYDFVNVHLNLRFYVKWISRDKIIKDINKIIWSITKEIVFDAKWNIKRDKKTGEIEYKQVEYNYNNLKKLAQQLKSNRYVNKNKLYFTKVSRIYEKLNDQNLIKDISNIKKDIRKTENLNWIYQKVLKYKMIFKEFYKQLSEIENNIKQEN